MNKIGDDKTMQEVCKIGQGADCCRYLAVEPAGIVCLKNDPSFSLAIDLRVDKMVAKADSCKGL